MSEKKKQTATYGPSGMTEVRLRKLMQDDEVVRDHAWAAMRGLSELFRQLRKYGYSNADCLKVGTRLGMIQLGLYMEEDTNYDEYIVENLYND